ncbi:hypothetical protein TP2_16660 [Thioclava pacifica DSM 10166]|uniref:Blue (type 1) copper domain-containing protein n=2 Tax=Thioclava pacifica TaxID=285109 RepID=A0A074JHI1_9RHOB|nr:hypothetical protein TP2_16660 [Thioclava pacifica DSM 10166]
MEIKMILTRRNFLVVAATAAPALAALPAAAAGETVIDVSLWDDPNKDTPTGLGYGMGGDMSKANMGIKVSQAEVTAGHVAFKVTNDSKDMIHEMVVSPIKETGKPLPYDADLDKVIEDDAGHLGEVAELDPGQKGGLTLDLKPGQYILYCNIPAHYGAGMWTVLTVK